MAYRVIWSPRASSHLEEICEYIAKDSSTYASIFAERILHIVKALPAFPESGRIVPEYNNPNLRETIYGNYRIVYRWKRSDGHIEIVAICHSARQIIRVVPPSDDKEN